MQHGQNPIDMLPAEGSLGANNNLKDVTNGNSFLGAANSRAKSNSINKTPEIKSQFRKNDIVQMSGPGGVGSRHLSNGSILGQQANMLIRGRSDKNRTAMQQHTSHELPSVVLK